TFLKNGDWLLIYRQNTREAFSSLRKARGSALVIFIFGSLGILTMVLVLSRVILGLLARWDAERQLMNQQVIEAGKLASVGELASGVAHEINNPVAIMIEEAGWVQDLMADDQPPPGEIHRALEQIKTQGNRCRDITRNLLRFARKTDGCHQEIQLAELIHEISDLAQRRARYNQVEISTELPPNLPPIIASPTEMQQVLLNLVNNAIDATAPDGGRLTLRAVSEKTEIRLEVSDTGQGIAPANLERIFDPFFTTKPVGRGTGLGLSICYGIVRGMGGDIQVESQMGQGTTFRLFLPKANARTDSGTCHRAPTTRRNNK
ncbi:MAG: ATP-binding protein, partial [Desulfobacterales bacterium]|nr:ATP-binding protein [Desulfobacterales bacterium]